MDITIYVNKKKINPLYKKAIAEYIKRLSPYCRLSVVCSPGRIKCGSVKNTAFFNMLIPSQGQTACELSSEDYADLINRLATTGVSKIYYLVGYSESELTDIHTIICGGSSYTDNTPDIKPFSVCTLSSGDDMTALLLSEQIYRAYTILNHITYHK